jgi:hypothetical protein
VERVKALIDEATNELVGIVISTSGIDLTGLRIVEPVPRPPHDYRWNPVTSEFDPRPPNAAEDLKGDPFWTALRDATPRQIDNWLTGNVTNLAEARRVLKLILLALRALRARRTLE